MKENNEIDTREVVIRVDNVKKSFKSYKDKATSFKERFVNTSRGKHEDVMVLKGISFEVHKGEAKFLSIFANITKPKIKTIILSINASNK